MTDWPQGPLAYPPNTVISSYSRHSPFGQMCAFQGHAQNTWPAANRALLIPFRVSAPWVVRRVFWYNGNDPTGNADMGIYTLDGRRLCSIGSTARTTNAMQGVNLGTPVVVGPGWFFFALCCGSTGTFFSNGVSGQLPLDSLGFAQVDNGAITLPATLTPARWATATFLVPQMGASSSTSRP
jgi:hypothetical protein